MLAKNFKAKAGPDLKIFRSPNEFAAVNGKSAVAGSATLGKLKSSRGEQEYVLPPETELNQYRSVLVHCDQYPVLWGGSPL